MRLTPDSIYYREGRPVHFQRIGTREPPKRRRAIETVRRITTEAKPGGGRRGFLLGLLPGVGLGLWGVTQTCESELYFTCTEQRIIVGVFGAGIALTGGAIGALIGNIIDEDRRMAYEAPVERYLSDRESQLHLQTKK